MKEILYIQAGSLANYVGTHFWNTQESYFTYGSEEGDEEGLVSNDVSFRESLTYKVSPDDPLWPIGRKLTSRNRICTERPSRFFVLDSLYSIAKASLVGRCSGVPGLIVYCSEFWNLVQKQCSLRLRQQ